MTKDNSKFTVKDLKLEGELATPINSPDTSTSTSTTPTGTSSSSSVTTTTTPEPTVTPVS